MIVDQSGNEISDSARLNLALPISELEFFESSRFHCEFCGERFHTAHSAAAHIEARHFDVPDDVYFRLNEQWLLQLSGRPGTN